MMEWTRIWDCAAVVAVARGGLLDIDKTLVEDARRCSAEEVPQGHFSLLGTVGTRPGDASRAMLAPASQADGGIEEESRSFRRVRRARPPSHFARPRPAPPRPRLASL